MFLAKWSHLLHKWLGLIIGLQVFFWVLGGLIFVTIPFQGIIKGGDYVHKIEANFEKRALYPISQIDEKGEMRSIITVNISGQPMYKMTDALGGQRIFNALNGSVMPKPSEKEILAHAKFLYKGSGHIKSIQLLTQPQAKRLLIVDELYGKTGLWQVSYDDALKSRLYFDVVTGEFHRFRNDAWVLYDLFWRLHVMDYENGENFDHWLIKIAAGLSFFLIFSGIILLFYSRFLKKLRPVSYYLKRLIKVKT
jgi:hypothetical protein